LLTPELSSLGVLSIDLEDRQIQGEQNGNVDDVDGWVNERDKLSYKES